MPLYLVRWHNLDLALVQARNEEALIDILDEVADPSFATWSVYRGPLYLGFKSPVKAEMADQSQDGSPLGDRQVTLEGVDVVLGHGWRLELEEATSETAEETQLHMLERSLPHVARTLEDEDLPAEAVREAIQKELEPLFAYRWKQKQLEKSSDPRAMVLKALGLTEFTPAMLAAMEQALAQTGQPLKFEPQKPERDGTIVPIPTSSQRPPKKK